MVSFSFRRKAVRTLTTKIGVYVLADVDNIALYVGQSKDGIRARVQRHLTSARSDIIANRQIDVWEIAYVWAFPVENKESINSLEARIFHYLNAHSRLMNGSIPRRPRGRPGLPKKYKIVQVMSDAEIKERKTPAQRLPRQANHYSQIVSHFLSVKNSDEVARAMDAHFLRLKKYHKVMMRLAIQEKNVE